MASSHADRYFQPEYQALQARGLSKIQALVVISRKIAKIAFALLRQQTIKERSETSVSRRVKLLLGPECTASPAQHHTRNHDIHESGIRVAWRP